jgi:CRISPR-associated protein Cpf1
LDGWDKNKEPNNYGVLLRKNGNYYLAVMKKGASNFFQEKKTPTLYEDDGS